MRTSAIPVDQDLLAAFAKKWGLRELSLFGSVLREDFGPASDVDVLIDILGRRVNVLSLNVPPLEHGLGAFLELVFVAQHDLRPLRQCQAEINPGAANVQVQIPIQIEGRQGKGAIVSPGIIIVPPPLLEPAAHETKIAFL